MMIPMTVVMMMLVREEGGEGIGYSMMDGIR
jgi:hypothetical protein